MRQDKFTLSEALPNQIFYISPFIIWEVLLGRSGDFFNTSGPSFSKHLKSVFVVIC